MVIYYYTNTTIWIVQAIATSVSTDNVTIEIRRMSDNKVWDFTTSTFQASAALGTMTYVSGITWKQSFIAPTADTYAITITDVTLDVAYGQTLVVLQNPSTSASTVISGISILDKAKLMMPAQFLARITDDYIILAFLELVLADFNNHPTPTAYTLDTLPATLQPIIAFGASVYSNLFLQGGYALEDFNYSDNGLSLNIDRHGSLSAIYTNQYESYKRMIENCKKTAAIRVGMRILNTPQYSSVFAQYLGSIFPGSQGYFK